MYCLRGSQVLSIAHWEQFHIYAESEEFLKGNLDLSSFAVCLEDHPEPCSNRS